MTKKRSTRRAPHMEPFVYLKPRRLKKPSRYDVWLNVDNQSFMLHGPEEGYARTDAEWFRDMLCIALARIVGKDLVRRAKVMADQIDLEALGMRNGEPVVDTERKP